MFVVNMHAFGRATAFAATLAVAATLLAGCDGDKDSCETVSSGSLGAVMVASTVRPRPPVVVNPPKVNPPKPNTPPTRATSTRTAPPAAPPTTATSARTSNPTAKPTTPAVLQPGKKVRKLKGDTSSYYPVPVVKQEPAHILLAQSAVRAQIETSGRFTKETKHTSPVTMRTYVYHSDDDYTKNVPQDLYDPFDPRNWTHQFSPFNLTTLIIHGEPVSGGPNLLNGDYAEEESIIDDTASAVPSDNSSPSDVSTSC